MPSVLITGANRGIGLALSTQYAEAGWQVIACCRDPKKADALARLENVAVKMLDVSDATGISALAKSLKGQAIDVLINNAGIYGGRQSFADTDTNEWVQVMRVNCLAPLHVTAALVENVAMSKQRKVVAITSRMGSIGDKPGGDEYAYRASKAALNMTMTNAAAELTAKGIAVCVIHPGWVRTDMGGNAAPVSPEDSAAGIRKVIDQLDISKTGSFWDYRGALIPW